MTVLGPGSMAEEKTNKSVHTVGEGYKICDYLSLYEK